MKNQNKNSNIQFYLAYTQYIDKYLNQYKYDCTTLNMKCTGTIRIT